MDGRGPCGPVRRADTAPHENGAECCHYVRHVRSHPAIPGDTVMTTLRQTHTYTLHHITHKDRHCAPSTPQPGWEGPWPEQRRGGGRCKIYEGMMDCSMRIPPALATDGSTRYSVSASSPGSFLFGLVKVKCAFLSTNQLPTHLPPLVSAHFAYIRSLVVQYLDETYGID